MNLETLKKLDKKYAQVIAAELLKRCETDKCLEAKLLETPKTLKGCIDYIKSEARKQAEDNCAVMVDDDVFQLAQHYFLEDSIDFEPKPTKETAPKKTSKKAFEEEKQVNELSENEDEQEEFEDNSNEIQDEVESKEPAPKETKSKKEIVKKKLEDQVTIFDFDL